MDALRGLALFGILLMHALVFSAPGGPPGFAFQGDPADRLVVLLALLFVDSKFFALFTFLFGVSFALQERRATPAGGVFARRFGRRVLVLFGLGALHVLLLWEGDVLALYSLVAPLLLWFRRLPPRALARWALALLVVPALLFTLGFAGMQLLREVPEYARNLAAIDAAVTAQVEQGRAVVQDVQGGGSYPEVLARRLESYASTFPLLLARAPSVLAMFLLGLLVGRAGLPENLTGHAPLLRRVRLWGVTLGLLASGLVVLAQLQLPAVSALCALFFNQLVAGPLLGLGYAAAFALFARRVRRGGLLRPLAAVGRMALTNYLAQSLVLHVLYYGYGLNLGERVSELGSVGVAVVVYALQVVVSNWWLRRFGAGPAERAWRFLASRRTAA